MPSKPDSGQPLLFAAFLAILTTTVYWRVGVCEFTNYDDPAYVTSNEMVTRGLTWEGVKWAFGTGLTGNWHPLSWLSHMLDCQLFGLNSGAHHYVNLLIHVANALCLFLVLRRMTGAFWPSGFVAAMFALHPLQVEAVAWVAERKHLLSTSFGMLTLWAYVHYVERPGWKRYLTVVLFLMLGLLAKPLLVTLPFVLLLLDYWPLGRMGAVCPRQGSGPERPAQPLSRLIVEKLPLFALSVASSAVAFLVARNQGAVGPSAEYPLLVRLANAVIAYVAYLGKILWPEDLSVLYPHPGHWAFWQVFGALLVLVLISLAVGLVWRSRPYLVVGWLWFLGTLMPMLGLVQVSYHFIANRYVYLCFIGLGVMLGWGVADLSVRWPWRRWVVGLAGVLVLGSWSMATSLQLSHWRNSITLFSYALAVTTNNAIAHQNLAQALGKQGLTEQAIFHTREAIRIKPDLVKPHHALGLLLAGSGQFAEAATHFTEAIRLQPQDESARFHYGVALACLGRLEEAAAAVHEALRLNPHYFEAQLFLVQTLRQQGRPDEAAREAAELVRLNPNSAAAHAQLGMVLMAQKKAGEARDHLQTAVRLDPKHVEALNNLAWLLASHPDAAFRNGAEAVKLAQQACDLTDRKEPMLLGTLAAAQAEAGQFGEAIVTAHEAAELATSLGLTNLATTNLNLLQRYQNRQPFRDAP